MIKVCPGIYVHFLTVVLFAVCYINAEWGILFVTYLIMLLHECAHLAAALALGFSPSRFVLYPFGVNLRLKNRLIPSVTDEIILYCAGPFANILMALFATLFFRGFFWYEDFYFKNIILCVLNLLPILPLDGGIVLKKILSWHFGHSRALLIMRLVSVVFFLIFLLFLFRYEAFNFSAWMFLCFLAGNMFTAKEKYDTGILDKLMFSASRPLPPRCRIFALEKGENPRDLLKEFTNNRCNILFVIGENGEIEKIMSEREVINLLLAN